MLLRASEILTGEVTNVRTKTRRKIKFTISYQPDDSNVPRPSYWAFKMASHNLGRGSLLKSETSSDNVTSYLSVDNGKSR